MDAQITPKRRYELKRRADEMADTRRRITEAAVELHGTVGPARTTMSSVAERAGVQRHTVYRYFPDEEALLGACSAHYYTANPLPDVECWRAISDPGQRLARALDELYSYYERTEPMLTNVLRDATLVDAVDSALEPFRAYLAEAATILAAGWSTPESPTPRARRLTPPRRRLPNMALSRLHQRAHPSRGRRARDRARRKRRCAISAYSLETAPAYALAPGRCCRPAGPPRMESDRVAQDRGDRAASRDVAAAHGQHATSAQPNPACNLVDDAVADRIGLVRESNGT